MNSLYTSLFPIIQKSILKAKYIYVTNHTILWYNVQGAKEYQEK